MASIHYIYLDLLNKYYSSVKMDDIQYNNSNKTYRFILLDEKQAIKFNISNILHDNSSEKPVFVFYYDFILDLLEDLEINSLYTKIKPDILLQYNDIDIIGHLK